MDQDLKTKLGTSAHVTVKVKPRLLTVKYIIGGAILLTVVMGMVFIYLNLGHSDKAKAGGKSSADSNIPAFRPALPDILSLLTGEELGLLKDRSFERDTIRKQYNSVKWHVQYSPTHLALQVHNPQYNFSLEIYDQNGTRVMNFINLNEEMVMVDKSLLLPNHRYVYVVRNTQGEIYAGNVMFN
ncbi:MAG: hypothetical protein KatS3mg031_0432 [Chitinophagales bacterium]|nr:MAG: hypothetical protein KatS3mg031_0432 [Chitinophagales bacterium]